MMGVHEDTLQGLQEALDYVKGDKSKARSAVVKIPDSDIIVKYNKLPEDMKQAINIIIDNALKTSSR
jgi:signal transduction histidine kinase